MQTGEAHSRNRASFHCVLLGQNPIRRSLYQQKENQERLQRLYIFVIFSIPIIVYQSECHFLCSVFLQGRSCSSQDFFLQNSNIIPSRGTAWEAGAILQLSPSAWVRQSLRHLFTFHWNVFVYTVVYPRNFQPGENSHALSGGQSFQPETRCCKYCEGGRYVLTTPYCNELRICSRLRAEHIRGSKCKYSGGSLRVTSNQNIVNRFSTWTCDFLAIGFDQIYNYAKFPPKEQHTTCFQMLRNLCLCMDKLFSPLLPAIQRSSRVVICACNLF